MFTDTYGEQSCTAGRSSFITGQSVYRTGLSKVGMPGAPIGMSEKLVTIAGAAEGAGLRHRPVRQEPPRRPEPHAADQPRLRRVLRQPLPPERRGRAGDGRLSDREGLPEFPQELRAARRASTPGRPTRTTRRCMPRWGKVGKQKIEDTGPLTKKRMETCDDEFVAAAKDFIKRAGEGRQAVVRVAQHHPHAPVHAHQEEEPRPGGPLAVAVPRHDDRPRQERRRDARLPRRARASPRTPSCSTRPTTARTATPGPTAA